jgi:hypothetical protein
LGRVGWPYELVGCVMVYRGGGDFNVFRYPNERSGNSRQSPAMLDYSKFIFYQGLMGIPLVVGSFTWSNNLDSQSWSRIELGGCHSFRVPSSYVLGRELKALKLDLKKLNEEIL